MTAVPRPVRTTAALAGAAGMLALAGCASGAADAEEPVAVATPSSSASASASASDAGSYADGTYTAEGSYQTPGGVEAISVTVTLSDDVITSVTVESLGKSTQSKVYQAKFIGGIADVVVGKDIDELSVSKVAGSSLTSGGFNAAIEEITAEAAS